MKIRVSDIFLYGHLLFFVLCSFIYIYSGLKPTANSLTFDTYVACLLVVSLLRSKGLRVGWIAVGFFLYMVVYFFYYVLYSEYVDYYEFFRSSRYLFYLLILLIMTSVVVEPIKNGKDYIERLTIYCGWFFFVVYSVSYFIFQRDRPAFYSENNYELASVLILFSILFYIKKTQFFSIKIILPVAITLLSRSKSAVLELVLLLLRQMWVNGSVNALKILYLVVGFLVSFGMVYFIFSDRMGGIEFYELDRFRFLVEFMYLLNESSTFQLFFGHGIASLLPDQSCSMFSYWGEEIFRDYSYCNSVIFHSFYLRVFYDVGLVGLLIFVFLWLYCLSRFFDFSMAMTLFFLISICSLSVSGFSSSLVLWPVFLIAFVFGGGRCDGES
jgi:hypothetical protein